MSQRWYCHLNLKPQGPFSLEEIREKIKHGEIGPQSLICDETSSWRPVEEWGAFEKELFPSAQEVVIQSAAGNEIREWVLLVQSADSSVPLQEGPLSVSELKTLLINRKVSPYQYVWKAGLSGWCLLKDRPEFASAITSENLSSPSLA